MIYISLKNLRSSKLNTVKFIFRDVIGNFIREYNFILLKRNIKYSMSQYPQLDRTKMLKG